MLMVEYEVIDENADEEDLLDSLVSDTESFVGVS